LIQAGGLFRIQKKRAGWKPGATKTKAESVRGEARGSKVSEDAALKTAALQVNLNF